MNLVFIAGVAVIKHVRTNSTLLPTVKSYWTHHEHVPLPYISCFGAYNTTKGVVTCCEPRNLQKYEAMESRPASQKFELSKTVASTKFEPITYKAT